MLMKTCVLALKALTVLRACTGSGCRTERARPWRVASLISVLLLWQLLEGPLTPSNPPTVMPLLQDCCDRQVVLQGWVFSASGRWFFTLGAKDLLMIEQKGFAPLKQTQKRCAAPQTIRLCELLQSERLCTSSKGGFTISANVKI